MVHKSQTTICREGWCYLALLVFLIGGAVMRQVNLLLIMAGMMVGLFLYHWRTVTVAIRGLQPLRRLPTSICAGDLLVVNIELCAKKKAGILGRWPSKIECSGSPQGHHPRR